METKIYKTDQYVEFYDKIASIFNVKAKKYLNDEKSLIINHITKFASSIKNGTSVLDLGAGSGRILADLLPLLEMKNKIDSVTIVDSSANMLGQCETKLKNCIGRHKKH